MKRTFFVVSTCLVAAMLLVVSTTQASDTESDTSKKEAREKARQERVDTYLQKKEAYKAQKGKTGDESEKPAAEKETMAAVQVETKSTEATLAAAPLPEAKEESGSWFSRRKRRRASSASSDGDIAASSSQRRTTRTGAGTPAGQAGGKNVDQVLTILRNSSLMNDEEGRAYLADVENDPSAFHMATLASHLAVNGYLQASVSLYQAAAKADSGNPTMWLNLGTVQVRAGQNDRAGESFQKVLKLDPTNARAHYNLGAVYSESDYDRAIREFTAALTLDPSLGDPKVNPQAANNDLLVPVKLMLYQTQEGSVTLPLVPLKEDNGGS
jgi:Flp pilus assembly protein TadD